MHERVPIYLGRQTHIEKKRRKYLLHLYYTTVPTYSYQSIKSQEAVQNPVSIPVLKDTPQISSTYNQSPTRIITCIIYKFLQIYESTNPRILDISPPTKQIGSEHSNHNKILQHNYNTGYQKVFADDQKRQDGRIRA